MSDASSQTPGRQGVDLLLLSASNYPALPIYPYAFVQVSALAARHGLTTARLDLLHTPKGSGARCWPRRWSAPTPA